MKEIFTIVKKEFVRFFTDKRLWINALILPGLMIYVLYSLMGSAFGDLFGQDKDYVYRVYAYHLPAPDFFGALENFEWKDDLSVEEAKVAVQNKEADAVIIFPEHFLEDIASYDPAGGSPAPNVQIYYNSARTESGSAYQLVAAALNAFESALSNKFDINRGEGFDLASEKEVVGQLFSQLFPMLMLIFLYSGCMSIAPDSIAGEKERGTLATMLVTPMKRGNLAVGKILSLGTLALLSGLSSFIGTITSLPKMMGGAMDGMNTAVYGAGEYLALLGIILSTVLLFVSIISVVSAFSKNVKEATTYLVPFMVLVMLCGVAGMFGGGSAAFWVSLIPVYNSIAMMNGILSFQMSTLNLVLTIGCTLLYTGVLIWVLTRMFRSERLMFNA